MIPELYFVTGNEGKISEAQAILEIPIKIVKTNLDEIQALELETIVKKKAIEAFEIVKKPLIVDDVGLYIETWGGFPGPFIKFLLNSGGNNLLLKMLASETNRNATAKAAIAFHDSENVHIFIGEVKGQIAKESLGDNGWGWDPIFIPSHTDKTYAQLSTEEKNEVSHRRSALEKLKLYLKDN